MLPSFIIEQIRQREEEERAKHPSSRVELPVPTPPREGAPTPEADEEADRGVVIIDLMAR